MYCAHKLKVYETCHVDFSGSDVKPSVFKKVLLGDKQGLKVGAKVLSSNAHDNVFIYFTDHGAVGLVAFPSE